MSCQCQFSYYLYLLYNSKLSITFPSSAAFNPPVEQTSETRAMGNGKDLRHGIMLVTQARVDTAKVDGRSHNIAQVTSELTSSPPIICCLLNSLLTLFICLSPVTLSLHYSFVCLLNSLPTLFICLFPLILSLHY